MRAYLIFVPAFALFSSVTPAYAQSDFGGLKLRTGDVVYVTTPSNVEISGRVTQLTATSLDVDGYRFVPEPGLTIERRGDRPWDGAGKGLLVGTIYVAMLGTLNGAPDQGLVAAVHAAPHFVFWGTVIDWLHVGRTTVFEGTLRPAKRTGLITPMVTPSVKSVTVALTF